MNADYTGFGYTPDRGLVGLHHNADQPIMAQSEIRVKETAGKPDRALKLLKILTIVRRSAPAKTLP